MTSRTPRLRTLLALTAFSALLATATASFLPGTVSSVEAQRLRATVHVTQAQIPRGLTEKALIGFARGHAARTMNEATDQPIEQRRWPANMVVAFNAPPGDLEYHALFYDVTNGSRDFVDDMAIYLNDRDQRTYVQRLSLARPKFQPNKRYELVITVRHAEVGNTRFDTRGEEIQRSGQVDFSVEDTRRRE